MKGKVYFDGQEILGVESIEVIESIKPKTNKEGDKKVVDFNNYKTLKGSFSIKNPKELLKQILGTKYYKFLKRRSNREKLYNKKIKKGLKI